MLLWLICHGVTAICIQVDDWDVINCTGTVLLDKQAMNALNGASRRSREIAQGRTACSSLLGVFFAVMACVLMLGLTTRTAAAETRSLKILFVHTGEKAEVVFKRNGRYDAAGLKKLSYLLRDWRRNEPTKMDPRLFDLAWEVYRRAGARGYINVLSGYRSPATNAMLRARSRGVAKKSQHMLGTAMDLFIPGTSLKTLREISIKLQAGGVGYYPNSGSPFVHIDVGGVRAWPRMSRGELARLFPDGKTLHIPADGKPMPGYQVALAEYKKRVANNEIVIASSGSGRKKNLFQMLFGGGDEDEVEDVAMPDERPSMVASASPRSQGAVASALPGVSDDDDDAPAAAAVPVAAPAPVQPTVVAAIDAPVPLSRPSIAGSGGNSLAVALYSQNESAAEQALNKVIPASAPEGEHYPDLQAYKIPVPTLLGQRGMKGDAEPEMMTASLSPDATAAPVVNGEVVPLPIDRPSVAEALEGQVDVNDEASLDEVEQAILSPEAAQAMESAAKVPDEPSVAELQRVQPIARPQTAEDEVAPAIAKATPTQRPVEVASINPPKPVIDRFNQAFEVPETTGQSVTATEPGKGGRANALQGEAARHMSGGKLTKDLLSRWAMDQQRFDAAPATKASRVVSRTLTAQPSYVYAVGFKEAETPVDPARFGKVQN